MINEAYHIMIYRQSELAYDITRSAGMGRDTAILRRNIVIGNYYLDILKCFRWLDIKYSKKFTFSVDATPYDLAIDIDGDSFNLDGSSLPSEDALNYLAYQIDQTSLNAEVIDGVLYVFGDEEKTTTTFTATSGETSVVDEEDILELINCVTEKQICDMVNHYLKLTEKYA